MPARAASLALPLGPKVIVCLSDRGWRPPSNEGCRESENRSFLDSETRGRMSPSILRAETNQARTLSRPPVQCATKAERGTRDGKRPAESPQLQKMSQTRSLMGLQVWGVAHSNVP